MYANANPILYFDPNGQSATTTWGAFGGAGEGAAAGAGSRGLGLLGPFGVVIGGMWPATMGDGTLDNRDDTDSETGKEECKDDDKKKCKLHSQNKIGLPAGKIRCNYLCQLGSGGRGFITRIIDGNTCPPEVDWVPGNQGF